jgi:hypothetical protein
MSTTATATIDASGAEDIRYLPYVAITEVALAKLIGTLTYAFDSKEEDWDDLNNHMCTLEKELTRLEKRKPSVHNIMRRSKLEKELKKSKKTLDGLNEDLRIIRNQIAKFEQAMEQKILLKNSATIQMGDGAESESETEESSSETDAKMEKDYSISEEIFNDDDQQHPDSPGYTNYDETGHVKNDSESEVL